MQVVCVDEEQEQDTECHLDKEDLQQVYICHLSKEWIQTFWKGMGRLPIKVLNIMAENVALSSQ